MRHHHAVDESRQSGRSRRLAVSVAIRLVRQDRRQLQRAVEVADEQQIFDVAHRPDS